MKPLHLWAMLPCFAMIASLAPAQLRSGATPVTRQAERAPRLADGDPIVSARNGQLVARPGYHFVRNPGGGTSLVSGRMGAPGGGGSGIIAIFSCGCACSTGTCSGSCDTRFGDNVLQCVSNGCTGHCQMNVTTTGLTAARLFAMTPELQRMPCNIVVNGRTLVTGRR